MTGLKAMFLDFSFTAISVLSGLVAAYLSSRTVRTTERFPNGMFALEPIYAICKAMLTMSLLLFSLVDVTRVAYDISCLGRRRIETGPVVIYEILTVAVCLGLYLYYRRENRRIRNSSTMLDRGVQEHAGRRFDVVRHRCGGRVPVVPAGWWPSGFPALHR